MIEKPSFRKFLLILFIAYGLLFIYRTSFVIGDERYFSLFDDAMVSMRYAKNLAEGHGLVWNQGEKVEGFSNPLWVFFMYGMHLLPIPVSKISLLVQLGCLVLLVIHLNIAGRLAQLVSGSNAVAGGAMLLIAFYLPLNNWSLQGMEVGLLALLVTLSLYQSVQSLCEGDFKLSPLFWMAVATFVRMDIAILYGCVYVALMRYHKQFRRRYLVAGLIVFLTALSIQISFRYFYYGDFFPNTYYLKLTGYPVIQRMFSGAYYYLLFAWKMNLVLFLFPVLFCFYNRKSAYRILLFPFAVQSLYSIYVGGDAWEQWGGSNRFIAVAMPGFLILLSYALWKVVQGAVVLFTNRNWLRAYLPAILFSVISLNCIYGPLALLEFLQIFPPAHTGDNHAMVDRALLIREITQPSASVAVTWSGAIPYFSERYGVDLLGKTDSHIAHLPCHVSSDLLTRITSYRSGHMKYDYRYSIGEKKPDVVAQLWTSAVEDPAPYLSKDYVRVILRGRYLMYLKKGSTNIRWDAPAFAEMGNR